MDFIMTNSTNWNNIIPIFLGISLMMMIFPCSISTIRTFKSRRVWNQASLDLSPNRRRCNFLGFIFFIGLSAFVKSFIAMTISICYFFSRFSLSVFSNIYFLVFFITRLAHRLNTVFCSFRLVKIRKFFNYFTSTTLFCFHLVSFPIYHILNFQYYTTHQKVCQ